MAKLDDIKAKAKAGLAAARRGIASGARATALGARRFGRRASAMSSAERRAFCARTAPERGEVQILAAVNRALRLAYKALDKPVQQIETPSDGLRIGVPLRMTLGKGEKARLAHLAGEAAVSLASGDLGKAGEYADDAIDLGSNL